MIHCGGGVQLPEQVFSGGGFRRFELLSHVFRARLGLQLWDLMASHIILETYFDEHETEEGLCIFQYIHDLQPAASTDLVRDPDHSLLQVRNSQLLCLNCFWRATVLPILSLPQRAIRYCKIIVFGKHSVCPLIVTLRC